MAKRSSTIEPKEIAEGGDAAEETPNPQTPTPQFVTVGRRVHYGVEAIAAGPGDTDTVVPNYADVLEVEEAGPSLRIHHPNGSVDIQRRVPYSAELQLRHWTWPPR